MQLNHSKKKFHPAHDDEQQHSHNNSSCSNTQSSSSSSSSSRNTWQVYTNAYSYDVVQQRTTQWYSYTLSGPGTLVKARTRWLAKRVGKKTRFLRECSIFLNHPFPCMKYLRLISIYTYEYTRGKFWRKIENSTPPRETTRARAGSPPAESGETSMVRHVEQTPHRMVDLISS